MTYQTYNDIYDEKLAEGAIINDRHTNFREDYLLLHILLRKYKIKSCFEVGCNTGFGTKIIKNALGEDSIVYSLDLPDDFAFVSNQHPISEGKAGVGYECDLPFTLLRGDSRLYYFAAYPCEAYYLDGEHTEFNVRCEVRQVMELEPTIIILHDTDMPEVMSGLMEAWRAHEKEDLYELYVVADTRISYFLKR